MSGTPTTVEAVDRVIGLLEQLSHHPDGVGVLKLAEGIGLAPSTTHRYLSTLQKHGITEQDEHRLYRLTARLYLIGLTAGAGFDLETRGQISLARLAHQSQETVCLMVRDGEYAVCIGQVDSSHQLKIAARLGSRQDLRLGATSRVLLAYAPEVVQAALLRRDPILKGTKNTITEPAAIRTLLEEIRKDGFYVSRGEVDDGVIAVAAPVRDRSSEVTASIALVAPEIRLASNEALTNAINLVTEEAKNLSLELGYSGIDRLITERSIT